MNKIIGILCGAGAMGATHYYGTDFMQKVKDWSETTGRNNTATQPTTPPINAVSEERVMRSIHVISERNEASLTRKALVLTSTVLLVYFGYSYFSSNANTKKVIDKVEDTAHETQDLVKECDENNQKRFEEIDDRAEERTNNLSVEIRGEQRAHFEVTTNQLNFITNICLQTINALAGGISSSDDGEIAQPNQQLRAYAEHAQEVSDRLFDRDTYLKAMDIHMDECRAQIASRKPSKMKESTTMQPNEMIFAETLTPGGPDNAEEANDNKTYKRKVSGTDPQENKTNKSKSIMDLQFVKNMKLGHFTEFIAVRYIDPAYGFVRQYEIVIGGLTFLTLCAASRQYIFNRNKSKNYVE